MTVIAGRYALEREIGRGGMGAVWRGRDEVLGRTVALKRIGVAPGGITPDALRAEREAKLAAKLNHANVVAVFDLVEQIVPGGQSAQWLVMEYVEGTDLGEVIRSQGRLTPAAAAPMLAQTASALAAAHSAGIVHRDVKPSNILVAPSGQVKLSDFGIARTAADPALTQTGMVTGSPAYLSPEVVSGQQATPASDVWSWGATLFHALEGRPPYQVGDNLVGALYRIVHEEPPRSEAAGWLAPVLSATMARDPAQRWPMASVREFLDAGPGAHPPRAARRVPEAGPPATSPVGSPEGGGRTRLLAAPTSPSTPVHPAPPSMVPQPGEPRRRWPLLVGAVLALVVVVGIAVAIATRHDNGGAGATHRAGDGPSATSSSSDRPSPSGSPAGPTEDGMTSFVQGYVAQAVADPATAFTMLTPEFQQESGDLDGYMHFWGAVRSAKILSISADPAQLQVHYTYRYVEPGGPTTDDVTLDLSYQDGKYLIAGES